jgi:hypothetical protein
MIPRIGIASCAGLCTLVLAACQAGPGPAVSAPELGYRFREVRKPAQSAEAARLSARYPELFAVLERGYGTEDADVRVVRADLVRDPSDASSYDALNSVAVVFFELHRRAERSRAGNGLGFLGSSFRATKVMAVPWRAYGDVKDTRLRSSIVDFFEDLLLGNKAGMRASRGRFTPTVESLLKWEDDPALRSRIESLVAEASELVGKGR